MTKLIDINYVLSRMIELLKLSGKDSWATSLQRSMENINVNPAVEKNIIISMYGGMGSLNDLILYSEGKLLLEENNEFDELRKKLYLLCQSH